MSRGLELTFFLMMLAGLIGFMWHEARKDRTCSITEMYRSMGHDSTEREGVWLDLDGKQEHCRYIFFEHGPGRIVGSVDRCPEGHLVISISIPKGHYPSE